MLIATKNWRCNNGHAILPGNLFNIKEGTFYCANCFNHLKNATEAGKPAKIKEVQLVQRIQRVTTKK